MMTSWARSWVPSFAIRPEHRGPHRVARFEVEHGSWPPPADGILLERVALQVLDLELGDTITVQVPGGRPSTLWITGVVHDPSLAPANNEAKGYGYVSTDALAALGVRQPRLDQLKITVADRAGETTPSRDPQRIAEVARDIGGWLAQSRGVEVEEIQVPAPYRHPHQGQMNTIMLVVLAFGALSLLLSSILVATMLGILKAIGARSSRVVQLYLLMVVLVAAAATALAFGPGILTGRAYSRLIADAMLNMDITSAAVPVWEYALVLGAGILLPLLMALVPLLRAGRTTVRQAMDHYGGSLTPATRRLDTWLSGIRGLSRSLLLALRNMFRRRARLVLSVGLLAAAGMLFSGAMNTYAGVLGLFDNAQAQHELDAQIGPGEPAAPELVTGAAAAVPGVRHVEAWRVGPAAIDVPGEIDVTRTYPDQGHGQLRLAAVPTDTSVLRLPMVEGRWLRPGDTDAIVLNESQQIAGARVRVGDTVRLSIGGQPTIWRVVGLEKEVFASAAGYVSPAGYARATGRPFQANQLMIMSDRHDPAAQTAVAEAAERALVGAGVSVSTAQPKSRYDAVVNGHLFALLNVVLAIAIVMGIVGCIGLGSTMSANVVERTRERGVMHAIGARARDIRRIVVFEGVFTALASCLAAAVPALLLTVALTGGISQMMLPVPLRISWTSAAIWVATVSLGAALATLAPAYRASRLTVREALAYL